MEQFSCSNYEQKRIYKDLFAAGKNDPLQAYTGLKQPRYNRVNRVTGVQACNFTGKKRIQHRRFLANIANFKNTHFEKHLRTAASDSSYILCRKLNKIIQEPDWPFVSFETWNYSILLTLIRIHLFYHSLPFTVTRCHLLSFVVPLIFTRCTTRSHLLSFVVPLIVIRCHSLYHSLLFVVTRCHSLSLDVPLVCLFINDR